MLLRFKHRLTQEELYCQPRGLLKSLCLNRKGQYGPTHKKDKDPFRRPCRFCSSSHRGCPNSAWPSLGQVPRASGGFHLFKPHLACVSIPGGPYKLRGSPSDFPSIIPTHFRALPKKVLGLISFFCTLALTLLTLARSGLEDTQTPHQLFSIKPPRK